MDKKLTIGEIIGGGIGIGLKNLPSLIGATILWLLTIWIPYINFGTTIAMSALPAIMSRGDMFSPTEIFKKKYLQNMGEYALLGGLMYAGILFGMLFLVIPGMVIAISWSLAVLLFIDKGVNPIEALSLSNKLTRGYKWTIFGANFIISCAFMLLMLVFTLLPETIAMILMLCVFVVVMPISIGCQAVVYKKLAGEVESAE